ncbi:sugar MFS transporter [Parafilimonas sp.]|uniref:sugar MFS transporter n=1 Tax=Parafilimonas sp. TaxID=1969739 RepID=UPI0039E5A5C7
MPNQPYSQNGRSYKTVALIMLTFFVISFLTNVIGPLVPDIIKEFKLNLTLVAILPFAFFIAYGVMSIPAGILNEKYKEKRMMVAAFILAFAGAIWLAVQPNYLTAIVSFFLIGCGMAILQVVINPLLRTSGGEEHFAFNSVMAQLFFGLASFVSPLVYSSLVTRFNDAHAGSSGSALIHILKSVTPADLPWISLYWLFAAVCLLMIIVILFSKFPKVILNADEKAGTMLVHLQLLKNKKVVLFFIGIFCYVGTEQGVANWTSQFLYEYHGYDAQTIGASAVAYFWGLMTAGSVLGLLLLKVMDSKKVLALFTVLAILSFSLGLFASGPVARWAFPMVGFFASVMYPVIFSLALNSVSENHGTFSGILLTGVTGGAVIPLVIGRIGDVAGLRAGMLFIYVTLGYILSIIIWAKPIISNKTIRIAKKESKTY